MNKLMMATITLVFLCTSNFFGQVLQKTRSIRCTLTDQRDDMVILLGEAVSNGDEECVKRVLKSGIPPNARYDGNISGSPIVIATVRQFPLIIDALLEAGLDKNGEEVKAAMALAASNGRTIALEHFLLAKVSPDLPWPDGQTPVMNAAATSDMSTVRLLLKYGADPNHKTESGTTALMNAGDDASIVGTLVDAGARIDEKDSSGQTAVVYAVKLSKPKKLEGLLKLGANPNIRNLKGITALEMANALRNLTMRKTIIDLLIKYGAR